MTSTIVYLIAFAFNLACFCFGSHHAINYGAAVLMLAMAALTARK